MYSGFLSLLSGPNVLGTVALGCGTVTEGCGRCSRFAVSIVRAGRMGGRI